MAFLGGPSFQRAQMPYRESITDKEGGHYNIYRFRSDVPDAAMRELREWFGQSPPNELNFVLFSTSGVHGSYATLEEIETSVTKYGWNEPDGEIWPDDYASPEVTVLIVQPRIVSMTYGNVTIRSQDDLEFLKRLRQQSWDAVALVGKENG
jgi:hypothetical protein